MRATLLLVLLAALAAPPAFAQSADDARARELYENGALLYEEGDYENAVVAWKEAYELSERPLLLYNIANALERIGEYQEAFDYLNRYRAFAPAEERETLDRRMRAIERRLEERKAADAAREQDAASTDTSNDRLDTSPGTGTRTRGDGPNPGPIVLMGAGLAGVATGGVFTGLAMSARSDAAALCAASGDDILCPLEAQTALDDDRTYSIVSDVSMIAGGAVAATGLVLAIVDGVQRKQKTGTAVRIIPSAGPEGGSVLLIAEF